MDLEIEGRHALLFDDDANAAFVNSREALVPWSDDGTLLIDRYDVRHLLDRIPPRPSLASRKHRSSEDSGGVSQSDLDLERYLDLPSNEDDGGEFDSGTVVGPEATTYGAYQAVPFSYGSNDSSADPINSDSGSKHSGFHPPFQVPTNLLNNLPPTEKLHQIIARTAIFVSQHGGQSEIVLRVKQGDNPTFGFLMPDNHLHEYFRFLVDHPQLLKTDTAAEENKLDGQENEAFVAAGGALSLLGSLYDSGEDDDTAPQPDSKEIKPNKANVAGNSVFPHKVERGESSSCAALEDKEGIKHPVTADTKEKSLMSKRNHSANAVSIGKKGDSCNLLHGSVPKPQTSQPRKIDVEPLILEPPSFLKRMIDKTVEFILRNGKEFEAVLIEQDKTAGRFPFLLPANQYNAYYLKVLQEALESKLPSKNPSDGSKRRGQEAPTKDSKILEQSEVWSLDPHRKEKFKMVIGGPKKDSQDQSSKPARQSGVSTDEAAAIVLAATRGRSPANAFQRTSVTDSDTGRASSIGSLSSLQSRKPVPSTLPGNGKVGDVSVATVIAKTVALAASSEADSSDASLTKEQKLKAERLKRAKMFAAMIKAGVHPTAEIVHPDSVSNGHPEDSTAGSTHEEREGSSVPFDVEASGRERNYRKKHHSRLKNSDEDSEEEQKHSKKKHRSDHHKHQKEKGSRHHHHKHHSDLEDDQSHRKSSRHHKRSRLRDSYEDDELERSNKHRSKHRSHCEKGDFEGKDYDKSLDHSELRTEDVSNPVKEVGTAAVSGAQPSDATEVPSELRAKIRAMLLATM